MFLLLGLGGVQSAAYSSQAATQTSAQGGKSINKVASIEQLTYIASVIVPSTYFPVISNASLASEVFQWASLYWSRHGCSFGAYYIPVFIENET